MVCHSSKSGWRHISSFSTPDTRRQQLTLLFNLDFLFRLILVVYFEIVMRWYYPLLPTQMPPLPLLPNPFAAHFIRRRRLEEMEMQMYDLEFPRSVGSGDVFDG